MLTAPVEVAPAAPVPAVGRGRAVAAGLLAGGAGLAAAEVLGRLLPGASSPVLALGNRVVGLAPAGPRRAAIDSVGTADKPLLLAAVLLVGAALAAWGGLLAR
ncbi:MAG: hypothetical protein JWM64_2799, partial [Frankiales bacterium]|nr:hypothetical protein [Frankiales bacterium]